MDFCDSHDVLISMLTYLFSSHTSRLQAIFTTNLDHTCRLTPHHWSQLDRNTTGSKQSVQVPF